MFSCEFCETSKNIFFIEHFWTTASVVCCVFTLLYWIVRERGSKHHYHLWNLNNLPDTLISLEPLPLHFNQAQKNTNLKR